MASCVAVVLCWALAGDWLTKRRVSAPMVMVLGGMLLAAGGFVAALAAAGGTPNTPDLQILVAVLDGTGPQQVAELILALLLFVDSFEIRRGVFGHEPRLASRLLVLALPLSIALGLGLGLLLFPGVPWAVVLVLVCIVVPTDLAPAASIVKDARLPERVRDALNVESGYNDGFVAPLFVFALTLAGSSSHASTPAQALEEAVPASLIAVAVGALLGAGLGGLMRLVVARGISSSHWLRYGVVCVPLLTYAVASQLHGNGFVAAFVAGIAFRTVRGELAHREVVLAEEVAALSSYVMWFVLGVCAVFVMVSMTTWQVVVFGVAALTLVRIVPVLIALLGSSLRWSDRWLVALLGPRGIATIVFALLAFNDFGSDEFRVLALATMTVTVLGSLLMHGVGAGYAADRYQRHVQEERPAPRP